MGEYNLVVERNGKPSLGKQIFYDKPVTKNQICVWDQIGILLKMIYEKESIEVQPINETNNGTTN